MDIYIVNKEGHLCYNTVFFQHCMRQALKDPALTVSAAEYQAIVGATATTKMKYEGGTKKILGLDRYRIDYQSKGKTHSIQVLVKSKTNYIELIERLAKVMIAGGVHLTQAEMTEYLAQTALYNTHLKEIMVYQQALTDPAFGAFFPPVYGTYVDEQNQIYAVIEGFLDQAYLIKDYTDIAYWNQKNIQSAITDLAHYHSIYYDRHDTLVAQGTLGDIMCCKKMLSLLPLWQALAGMLEKCVGPLFSAADYQFHLQLIDNMAQWWGTLDGMTKTLIFNDIQIRNFAMREKTKPQLCLFDWECTTIHIPQRDLVELLSYILGENVGEEAIDAAFKLYFDHFNQIVPHALSWQEYLTGCLYALYDFQIDRLAMQLALDRIIARPDIARVFKTSRKLLAYLQKKL